VILDDSRNPRGILSARLRGGARAVRWAISGLDCKTLPNAFGTDGVPSEAVDGKLAPLPAAPALPPPRTAENQAEPPTPGTEAQQVEQQLGLGSGFALEPSDGIVHAQATFPSASHRAGRRGDGDGGTAEGGVAVRVPLRLVLEGAWAGNVSLNGTPICRYHGDLGPQRSFFLPDGTFGGMCRVAHPLVTEFVTDARLPPLPPPLPLAADWAAGRSLDARQVRAAR
jgi:hypothetical protein